MTRSFKRQALAFLLAGAANTGLTYLAYLTLLRWIPYGPAYSISYVAGILLSFALNSQFVFGVRLSLRKLAVYPLVYLAQFGLGYAVLYLAVDIARLDPRLGPVLVLAVTVPVSFVLTRWVLRRREGRAEEVGESG